MCTVSVTVSKYLKSRPGNTTPLIICSERLHASRQRRSGIPMTSMEWSSTRRKNIEGSTRGARRTRRITCSRRSSPLSFSRVRRRTVVGSDCGSGYRAQFATLSALTGARGIITRTNALGESCKRRIAVCSNVHMRQRGRSPSGTR